MDNPFITPAVLSLCPGMLGLERGLERAIGPIRTLAYVEIEAFIIENLVQQMEKGLLAPAPIWSNAKNFPFEIFRDKIHWIVGGYPCQPFSHAGTRGGADDPRHLWPFIKSGIKKSRPVGVWFENVEGHLSLGLRDVLADLRKLGYQTEVGIFSAAEVGAPHRRNRVFILGLENAFLLGNGRRYIEDFVRECEIQTSRSGELDHAGSHGLKPDDEISARRYCAQPAGQRLADPYDKREPQLKGFIQKSRQWPIDGSEELGNAKSNNECREWIGGQSGRQEVTVRGSSYETMGNSDVSGLEGRNSTVCGECPNEWTSRENGPFSREQWPAFVGQEQYSWEPPRLEFSLGYVFNGYNYREDLLRMAGNAVVEQTAELAFRTLIRKFL